MAVSIIIPAAGPAMAPEALFWLVAGVIWVVVQVLQRAMRQSNRAQPPPSIGGKEEKRDLDDFLEEMFERAGDTEREQQTSKATQRQQQTYTRPVYNHPGGSATSGSATAIRKPTGTSSAANRIPGVHALNSKSPKVHLTPDKKISLQEKRNAVLLRSKAIGKMQIGQPTLSTRSPVYAYMPSMPGMNLNQERGRRPHKLTGGLKSTAGLKRAVLWREILAPPRAFTD